MVTSKIYCLAHAAQYQKKNKKTKKTQSKKRWKRSKQTFIQIRYTDGQNTHEKKAQYY